MDGTGATDGTSETEDVDEVRLVDRINEDDLVDSDELGEIGDVSGDDWGVSAVSMVVTGLEHFLC